MSMRMTNQRKEIISILKKSPQPKSAEMIFEELPKHTMNLSTVYRTMDAFFQAGMISKSNMNNTTYYYLSHKHHHHYLICLGCQKMYEMDCHIDHIASEVAKHHHFKITHHDMTVYGYCEDCQARM